MGSYAGAAKGAQGWTEHEKFGYDALEPGEVLVVVCSHGHADAVNDVMQECGARVLHRQTRRH
jgi:hypothetical protein